MLSSKTTIFQISNFLLHLAVEVKPYMVTLMPFIAEDVSLTSGIDMQDNVRYAEAVVTLQEAGIAVGYFIDPETDAVKDAARAKVDAVELNAHAYVNAETIESAESELERLDQAAQLAAKLGILPNCGNGLNYKNIRPLADLDIIEEFTVGHAIIGRAVMVGLDRAVGEMVDIVHRLPQTE